MYVLFMKTNDISKKQFMRRNSLFNIIIILFVLLVLGAIGYHLSDMFQHNNVEITDYRLPPDNTEWHMHESHNDYSSFAKRITVGSDNNYKKIRAIYNWICTNIEYDTSFSIYTADDCYKAKKGVCQAYCELFYQLAKAVGINTEIVRGLSKDYQGKVNTHAWIKAYTEDNACILLDPTWGAGTVDNGRFTRSNNIWMWFDVLPEWMIFSHFPEEDTNQFLNNPLSMEEFVKLTPANYLWVEYGLNIQEIFDKARSKELNLPTFYNGGEGCFEILNMPLCSFLKKDETYTFRIRVKTQKDFAILNDTELTDMNKWEAEGNGIYSINYLVNKGDYLSLSVKNSSSENQWSSLIKYKIH